MSSLHKGGLPTPASDMLVCRKGKSEGVYEASDVLGQGSFGTVYLGEDLSSPGRKVALKSMTCRPGKAASWEEAVAEAELLQKLRHPNVLRCYEWFEDQGSASAAGRKLWIVMEYMDGGDLNSMYNARRRAFLSPLEAPFIRRVITSVGGALKYIHGMGVLHRDVKCMNVLLSRNWDKMVLADFGLSCSVEEQAKMGEGDRHAALGTPTYMSPEVLCGKPHSVASDAWSLGVLAFKLAALERPFTARDDLTLTMRIVKNEPKELPVGCAADVANAVMGLLDKAPEKRLRAEDAMVWTQSAPIARLSSMGGTPLPPRLSCL